MEIFDKVIDDVELLLDISSKSKEKVNMFRRNVWVNSFILFSRVEITFIEEEIINYPTKRFVISFNCFSLTIIINLNLSVFKQQHQSI